MRQTNHQLLPLLAQAIVLAGCTNPAEDAVSDSVEHRTTGEIVTGDPNAKEFGHVSFPELGAFQPERFDTTGELLYYTSPIRFRDSDAELVIYPNPDGTAISAAQGAELSQRFDRFQELVDVALSELPAKLRPVCSEYEIDMRRVSDVDIVSNVKWHNIKLLPDGAIECYTSNRRVTEGLDIVLGFSNDMSLDYVYFDG